MKIQDIVYTCCGTIIRLCDKMEGKDELDHRAIAADISEDEHILQVSEEIGVSYLDGEIIKDINNIILDLDELIKVAMNLHELETNNMMQ